MIAVSWLQYYLIAWSDESVSDRILPIAMDTNFPTEPAVSQPQYGRE